MEGTRLRILRRLQKQSASTVEALAENIGLAPATIRRHLDILQRDHLVAFEEVRKKTGRPEYSFFLTDEGHEALPKGYDMLLSLVVGELAGMSEQDVNGRDGHQVLELVFQRLAHETVRLHEGDLYDRGMPERLKVLEGVLDEAQFSPEIIVEGPDLRINLLNCPFRMLALKDQSVCRLDQDLVASILGVEVRRNRCISDGDPWCAYVATLDNSQLKELEVLGQEKAANTA